jgi:hypothetical protein
MPATALSHGTGVAADELAHALHRTLEQYLADHPHAVVLDEGRVAFEMARSSYSLRSGHGRCVLHLWSEDQNCVRTVVGLQARRDSLSVRVKRFGRVEPQVLQFVADRDTRTPTTRQATRTRFLFAIERLVARQWSDWKLVAMRSAMDLEHSFGPAYARGLLTRGQSAWALIAVNPDEMPATIDGILTLGILWLHQCREQHGARRVIQGLRVIMAAGATEVTAARISWLNPALTKWELWEIEPQGDAMTRVEISRQGNLKTRLVRACNPTAILERFAATTARVLELVPAEDRDQVELRVCSTTEVALSLHGLEFARVRHGLAPGTFARQDAITFGAGPNETELTEDTAPMLRELVVRLFASRRPNSGHHDALYRLQPERWLEALLRRDLAEIEPSLNLKHIYSQVPAFAAGDRGMLDLLTVNRSGRVAVLELKADDDLQLPLQGLDYWLRVYQLLHRSCAGSNSSALQASGYFPGLALSEAPPLLYFVAPALRIHPENEIVLAYFAEEIEWNLIALNEDWRTERKVIFRKHSKTGADPQFHLSSPPEQRAEVRA